MGSGPLGGGGGEADRLFEGLLQPRGPDFIGADAELLARGTDVALEQRIPEADPDAGADSCPVRCTPGGQPNRRLPLAEAGERHRRALHLEADLDVIAKDQREPQALAIELQTLSEVPFDQRAVGKVVIRKMLAPRVRMDPAVFEDLL